MDQDSNGTGQDTYWGIGQLIRCRTAIEDRLGHFEELGQ